MSDWDFIPTTNMLVVNKGRGLFIKRDESLSDFPGWLMLPGGKQKEDETPLQAATRETKEETGLKIINPKLKIIATHNHYYKNKVYLVYIFLADRFTGRLINYEKNKGKPFWIDLEEALDDPKLYPDLKRHIKLLMENKNEQVIFTYHKYNKNLEIIEKK